MEKKHRVADHLPLQSRRGNSRTVRQLAVALPYMDSNSNIDFDNPHYRHLPSSVDFNWRPVIAVPAHAAVPGSWTGLRSR